ncbi:MAG: orotidine-5'-phosphate decarboxylase [Candidatus Sumerlaeia bacterium]|nr:orotidine-5'-phosphate decarboxylase [Candidatus Sumerlaeia bacterium]
MNNFFEKLEELTRANNSLLCVGLDSDLAHLPKISLLKKNPQVWFNHQVIEATSDLVCAYKINFAFYESLGSEGWENLTLTRKLIPPHIPVIADTKRNDIGNTARHYAKAIFEILHFDATTVNPYLGYDSLEPFFQFRDKGVFVLCLTSNPGASDFQLPDLFLQVAEKCRVWNDKFGNVGLVVGATYPEQMREIRQTFPEGWFLVPGVGAQQGDLETVVRTGLRLTDNRGLIINVSRSIIFASAEADFAQEARATAEKLRQQINSIRGIVV